MSVVIFVSVVAIVILLCQERVQEILYIHWITGMFYLFDADRVR